MSSEYLGVDVGGVLVDRIKADGSDTSFFSDRFLETPEVAGAFETLTRLVGSGLVHVFVLFRSVVRGRRRKPGSGSSTIKCLVYSAWTSRRSIFAESGLTKRRFANALG